jgi:hypothetical protein
VSATITMVWVRTQFTGFHRWKDAPDEVAFLRDWHRHVFHVRLGMQVTELDREVEFFQLKAKVDSYLAAYDGFRFEMSCEQLAALLQRDFGAVLVEVSEDGECGATVFLETVMTNIQNPKELL